MAIVGTERILPPDTALPRGHGPVEVRFGPPIEMRHGESQWEATRRIERAMVSLVTG